VAHARGELGLGDSAVVDLCPQRAGLLDQRQVLAREVLGQPRLDVRTEWRLERIQAERARG